MKEIISEILSEFYKDTLPDIIKRDLEMPSLPKNIRKAFVFIGMRRVGKTYLMYQHMKNALIKDLEKEKLLYLNFEDDRLENFTQKDFQTVLDVYFERFPKLTQSKNLLFYFDEIQNVKGWESFIRRLLDKEHMSIFITGSSAKLLSKEIASSLRGRCLEQEVFPLSFSEYLHYQGLHELKHLSSKDKSTIRHHANTYLRRGGFPETLALSDSLHQEVIQSYVNSAVFRDVIERYNLTSPHIVKLFLIHCLQNVSSPLSITKIYKTLKSRGEILSRSSLYEYMSYFEDAYLICSVPIFDLSTRKRQVNPNKIYCVDPGIITAYSIKPQTEHAARLETVVYVQLRKQGFENIYYHKTKSGKEIDFVAQTIQGEIHLYQVCVHLNEEKTRQREITALLEAAKEFKVNEAWIITTDTNEIIKSENVKIYVIPYWQWSVSPIL